MNDSTPSTGNVLSSAWKLSWVIVFVAFLGIVQPALLHGQEAPSKASIAIVVMDPLAAPLACDCVQGYAQRKYEALAGFIAKKLGRRIDIYWAESLATAMDESGGRADLIIGKHSVVLSDAAKSELQLTPIAQLTDLVGETTQTGLIVVRSNDQATSVADLKGYRIFFGPDDCEEKSAAPKDLLTKHEVTIPSPMEISPACSSAATKLIELDANISAAAIISSYAEPLLEGCGKVEKGALRVVGISEPVPFITAFANEKLSAEDQASLRDALLAIESQPALLRSMESLMGFVEFEEDAKKK